ncbi:MAG: methionyl-tRNA formyltransferase [Planctomycetota bacterium]
MRVVFFGSSPFGLPTLERLTRECKVEAVVTQPDRPAGRKRKLSATPVGAWCAEHLPSTPVHKEESVNQEEIQRTLRRYDADAWVVIAFGQKLSKTLLANRFAINLHASILPRWRGAAPIHAAMVAGDQIVGNSVITLAERMDAGLVLGQSTYQPAPDETTGEVHDKLSVIGAEDILNVLHAHERGEIEEQTQDESEVTYAKKLSPADGWVDFRADSDIVRRRINGLSPKPGVSVELEDVTMKLIRAGLAPIERIRTGSKAGTIIDAEFGLVACGNDEAVRLIEVQPAGKKTMEWSAFLAGRQISEGAQLLSAVPVPLDA